MVMYAVFQLATRPGSPDSLQHLIEIARSTLNSSANYAAAKDEKVIQSRDKKVKLHYKLSYIS
jgi:CCR4-NOT transcription complex subunit 1